MVLSSADIFFQNHFFCLFFSNLFFGNISRVSSSLDPDHAHRSKLFAKVISRRHIISIEFITTIQAN